MQQNAQNSGIRGISGAVRIGLTSGGPLVTAQFVARPQPLMIEATAFGRLVRAHLPDSPLLGGRLSPGTVLLLAPREGPPRKPAYQVVAVQIGEDWLSLDDQLALRLTAAALAQAALPQFARYAKVARDISLGGRQLAFRAGEGPSGCLIEVRGTSRVEDGIALYPHAGIDRRLTEQIELLTSVARTGQRAALLFMVQRSAVRALIPAEDSDPGFSRVLRTARANGVEVYAYRCPLTPAGITLGEDLPVFASREAIPSSQWE
jgi:sugar fermentation stimulation protein A